MVKSTVPAKKELTVEDEQLAQLVGAAGWPVAKACKMVGLSQSDYRELLLREDFKQSIRTQRQARIKRICEAASTDPERAMVKKLVKPAVGRLKKILTKGTDHDANKAADTSLKYSIGEVKVVEGGNATAGVILNIGTESMKAIEALAGNEPDFMQTRG